MREGVRAVNGCGRWRALILAELAGGFPGISACGPVFEVGLGSFGSNFRFQAGGGLTGRDDDRDPMCLGVRPQTLKQQQTVASRQADVEENDAGFLTQGDPGGLKSVCRR